MKAAFAGSSTSWRSASRSRKPRAGRAIDAAAERSTRTRSTLRWTLVRSAHDCMSSPLDDPVPDDAPPPTVVTEVQVLHTPASALAGQLAEEMQRSWKQGRRVRAEELLEQHPDLRSQRDAVLRLVCEEICLRREAGLTLQIDDWTRRFPDWRLEIESLIECQKL